MTPFELQLDAAGGASSKAAPAQVPHAEIVKAAKLALARAKAKKDVAEEQEVQARDEAGGEKEVALIESVMEIAQNTSAETRTDARPGAEENAPAGAAENEKVRTVEAMEVAQDNPWLYALGALGGIGLAAGGGGGGGGGGGEKTQAVTVDVESANTSNLSSDQLMTLSTAAGSGTAGRTSTPPPKPPTRRPWTHRCRRSRPPAPTAAPTRPTAPNASRSTSTA